MTAVRPAAAPTRATCSFGRARPLRPSWRAAIAERLPACAITLPAADDEIDPCRLFDTETDDVWLELGFGAGEHLLGRARANPSVGFVGCEPYLNGMAAMLARAEPELLRRVRVFGGDARQLLPALRTGSLGRIFVLFSDPWPKRRHHRRRLVQAETLAEAARLLRPGGELMFASDHEEYVRWTLALALERPDLAWLARRPGDWRNPPDGWVDTRYQKKAEARGSRPHYLRFARV